MPRYVAFLRGVSPMNCAMPALKAAFEAAGFRDVRTLLSSGNVAFSVPRATSEATLQRRAEAAIAAHLDRRFTTIVRSSDALRALLDTDPYAGHRVAPDAKRVITFMRDAPAKALPQSLPIERDGAGLYALIGREVYTAYLPGPSGPVFMALIEKTFGTDVTTRTWDTVRKCAAA